MKGVVSLIGLLCLALSISAERETLDTVERMCEQWDCDLYLNFHINSTDCDKCAKNIRYEKNYRICTPPTKIENAHNECMF